MPLFSRPDGDLVRGEAPVRRIMPYLMRGRNESCVYQESLYRIAAARVWLKAYNRAHHPRATLFHLVAYAVAVTLEARPRLNRFVSGGRIYQRRGVSFSFVAKKDFTEEGEDTTVKLTAHPGETFPAFSARISTQVDVARETERSVDREVALIMHLPGPLVRLLVALARPQAVLRLPKVQGTVMLVFDVSGSMAADDLKPTRMEAAKAAATDFVERQPKTVQIGVVAFSDSGLSVQAPSNDQVEVLSGKLLTGILDEGIGLRSKSDEDTTFF